MPHLTYGELENCILHLQIPIWWKVICNNLYNVQLWKFSSNRWRWRLSLCIERAEINFNLKSFFLCRKNQRKINDCMRHGGCVWSIWVSYGNKVWKWNSFRFASSHLRFNSNLLSSSASETCSECVRITSRFTWKSSDDLSYCAREKIHFFSSLSLPVLLPKLMQIVDSIR